MRLLSFPLEPATPTYGDNPPTTVRQVSSIADGAVANWFEITTINHNGTHLDAPFHFWQDGPRLTDLPLESFIYTRPLLIDLPKGDGELITAADLEPHAARFGIADLLLVRTGYGRVRADDPARYGRRAPGFHPDAADVLLAPSSALRGMAMDIPSAGSPVHGAEAIRFHQEVLGATGRGRTLVLIEDVRLDPDLRQEELGRVLALPLMLAGLDAAPCTILAEPPSGAAAADER